MPSTFWSLTYKSVPRHDDVQDELLLSIMLKRRKEEGTEYQHACCVENGEPWSETPESFVAFLNRQFTDSPLRYVLVQKREITEEEYRMQHEDKERRAVRNTESLRSSTVD